MQARTLARVAAPDRLRTLHCQPPLTLRRVHADQGCGLCLVGTAAGPLPGDELNLELQLDAGARASICASGASLAQGGRVVRDEPATPATMRTVLSLGDGAHLTGDTGPLIACHGARVDVHVQAELAADATLEWTELLILGRHSDPEPGLLTIRWDVTRAGRPVLRQLVDLRDTRLRSWPAMTGRARVLATRLHTGPDVVARTVVAGPAAVTQALDPHTALSTVLGDDAATVQEQLQQLCRSTVPAAR